MIQTEDIPAWKATLLLLGEPYARSERRLVEEAKVALGDTDPMVRSAAVQLLAPLSEEHAGLRPLLKDAARLVRLDAESALSFELSQGSPERQEFDAYLAVGADQPAGQFRIGQDLFNRGRFAEAETAMRRALEWDPHSPTIYESLGVVIDRLGRPTEAGELLWQGAKLIPSNAECAYQAGLAFAEGHMLKEAELALSEAVRRDPRFDRAWYNLGLLLAHTGRLQEAVATLQQAEALAPDIADYPYARATVLSQLGDQIGASAAAQRAQQVSR
jgi:tetratricopeptide (TPR) repeat protein